MDKLNPKDKPYFYESCPTCNGTGWPIEPRFSIHTAERRVTWDRCEDCEGNGLLQVAV